MNRLSTFLIFIFSSIVFRSSAFDCSDIITQVLCSSSILCTWSNGLCTGSMTITCPDHCVFVQNFNMTQSGDGSLQFPSNSLTDTIDAISKPTTIILIALNYADVFEVAGLHVLPNSTTIKPFVDTIRPRIQLANSFSLTWTLFEENPDILTISIENLIFEPADTSQVRNVPFVDLSSTRLTVEVALHFIFGSNGPFISLDFGNFLVSNTVFQDSENFYINYATKVNRPAVITISITDSVVYNLTGELFLNVSDSANIILQNVTINQNIQESTLDQNCWINVLQEAGLQFTDSVVTDSSLCLIKMDLETISSQFQLDNVSLNNIDLLANKVLILVVNAQDFDISNLELTNIFNVKTLIAMQDSIVTIENLTLYNINAFYEESQLFDGVQLIGSLISGYNNELSMTGINATNISSPAIYLKQSEIDLSVANFKNTEYATSLNSDRFSSLILLDSSIMNMNSSIFSGFNGVNGGVISFLGYYINQGTTILQNSIFQNNFAQNYGGVIFSENVQCFIEIENCSFTNNSAVDGGVINIKAQSLNFFSDANSRPLAISNSTFEKNQASDKGGVIFSKDFISVENSNFYENTAAYGGALYRSFPLQENPNNVQDILTSCQFHMNTATEQGGAFLILTRDTNYQISGIDYFENTAPIYDDFFIGLPTSIVMKAYSIKSDIVSLNENQRLLQDISQLDTYKNQELFSSSELDIISQYKIDIKSGSYLSQILELSVLDQNGNIHLGIHGDSIDISLDNCDYNPENQSNSLKGKTSIAFVNGRVLLYNQFESYAGINRNCSLIIKSNQQASPTLEESSFNIAVNFTIGFSGCSYGQVFDQTLQICKSCEPGTYSLTDPDSTYECTECPFDKADCPGNNIIALKPGYWRQNEFTDLIRECPDVSNACLGSMYDTNYVPSGKCQELREGPFCEECISGYIKIDNPSECINCANNKLYYFRYAGFLIIQTGLLLASLYLNIKRSLNAQSQDEISKKRLSFRTTLLKIHINFLQSMSIISRLKLRWTKRLNMIPILLSDTVPMNEDAITSECIIESVFQGILSSHFVRFVIISCLPLLLWLISIIVFRAIKRNRTNPLMPLPKFMIVSFITIASIFQPAILQIGLKTFDCTSLFDGNSDKTFMREDLTIECSSNTFYALALGLVIPFLMFWAVILPAALFLKLRQNKNVKVPNFHASVFAPSDQERTYYWGYVFYLEKFILILVSVFLTSVSLRVQVLIAFVVLLLLFILQMKHKPYHDSKLNKVESFSVLILMLYVYSGLFFINDINTVSPDILLLVGFVVVLSVYLGHFIVFMIRPFKNKIFVTIGTQELFAKDSQRDISPTSQLQSTDRQRLRTKQFSSVMNYNLERGTPSSVTDSKIDGILLTNEPLSTARLFSQKENGTLKDCSTPTRYREQQCD